MNDGMPFRRVDIKSIAIFRALQLGDMLCSIPAVRAICRTFPEAEVAWIGLPGQKQLAQRFGHYFSSFVEFPGWPGLPEREFSIPDVMEFLSQMQQRRFDLVIQMQGNGYIVNPMCMVLGARWVAGLRREGDYCPNEALFPVMQESEHEILRFMKIADALGANTHDTTLEFPFLPGETEWADAALRKLGLTPGKYLCLHGGARDPRRRWPAINFSRVGDALSAEGYQVVLTGSLVEEPVLNEISRSMASPVINLVERYGQVGIGKLAALIGQSGGLVSNDTGVSHIASALRIRSAIIFSRYSEPNRWKPLDGALHRAILPDFAENVTAVIESVLHHFELHQPARLA